MDTVQASNYFVQKMQSRNFSDKTIKNSYQIKNNPIFAVN